MKSIGEWLQQKLPEGGPHQRERATGPSRTSDNQHGSAHPTGPVQPGGRPSGPVRSGYRPGGQPRQGRRRGRSRSHPFNQGRRDAPHNLPQQQPAQQTPRGSGGLRIYPLGGFEQIGRNCLAVEVDGDIYLIDLGLQFPDEDMLGIDYLIPDITALQGRENRIKAILLTHGHLDHIGAIQHLLPALHFPPCYGTKLTMAMVRKRLDEEGLTGKATLHTVSFGDCLRLGAIEVEFLRVTHSIPDSAAIALHTPAGTIIHTGDFKFDLTPTIEPPADFQRFAQLGKKGVLAIVADSTNATKPGQSPSEREISQTLFHLIRDAEGRVIFSTFSSLLNRIQQIVDIARQFNRKVFISGRSMETNTEIAQNLGYLKAPRGLIRKAGPGMDRLPDREVLIITTGSQGEETAGLARIGLGTHRHIAVKKGDTVIMSSNPIIGNERAVTKVINNLHLKGAAVKTNAELALHATGHGHQSDLLMMHRLVRAKHVIPEHGEPYMRYAHAELVRSIGYPENQVHLLVNGEILEFDAQGHARKSKQKFTCNDVIIDGKGSAGEGQRVITDRKIMSQGGAVVVILKAYADSKRLVSDPDVLSRGLIYGSEQTQITGEVIQTAKKAYTEAVERGEAERKALKRAVTGALYRYFDRKLNREPMVVPIIVEV